MKVAAIALLLGGCVVNGKAYGPGARGPSPAGPSGSSPSSAQASSSGEAPAPADDRLTPDGRVREDARYYKEPPYLSAPADPWAAVQGDQPLRWTEEAADHWTLRGNTSPCTALQDHCLVKDTWFFVRQSDVDRKKDNPSAQVAANVGVFGPKGPARPWNARSGVHGENLTAYRTVPATKHNLVPGALVIGLSRSSHWPGSGIGAIEAHWVFGVVEEVQLDLGVYRLKDYDDSLALEGARVAVLSYKDGGKVQIIGGKSRDQLAVKASDVFLPPK